MKKIKLLSFLSIIILTSFFATGCGKEKEEPFMTKDHKIIEYEQKNLPEERYYILKKNGKFQPLLQKGLNDYYVWFTKFDNLIPTFESGDKLIFTSVVERPYAFKFNKMKDLGYTVGIRFKMDYNDSETKEIFSFPTSTEDYCPFSKVGSIVGSRVKDKTTNIVDINGTKITPLMFSEEGFLKGLNKNAMYQFGYYYGTKYSNIDIMADTHVYTKSDTLLSNNFKETKKGYIEISLPEDITGGTYNLDEQGGGLLRVDK